ncbi:carboxypeptidase-like regulatory domain-containing protein [Chitinophaga sp. Hz27]|uniref:carboxypeptidase-like regulatory domain-containing protein n=1 Tax=Chitinophaga sp. Hz27 TaxID=3347169 RepID=UPI0035D9BA8D
MMKLNFLRPSILPFLFILFSISACDTGHGDSATPSQPPPPATGILNGSVAPLEGITSVSLDTINGGERYNRKVGTDGKFQFTDVIAGEYNIRMNTTPLYTPPSPQRVTIAGGQNVTQQSIVLKYNASLQTGKIDFIVNGSPYSIFYDALFLSYLSPAFRLTGSTSPHPNYYYLDISLPNVSDTGSFDLYNSPYYVSLFYYASINANDAWYWSSQSGGSGTVHVTALNTTTRTVSGTVSASLTPQGASPGTKEFYATFTNIRY